VYCPSLGTVVAVDPYSGKKVWDVPLGTQIPNQHTGAINLGGPMITAGGLVFTGAAIDGYIRAFDVETGKEVWSFNYPPAVRRRL
jgi:quinoprotein glucose dehydrogenase